MKKLSLKRIRRFFKDNSSVNKRVFSHKDYLKVGATLKARREQYSLTRHDLSINTRISITVLEAIEEGWIERLPERAYLTKMINLLSKKLEIPIEAFIPILDASVKSSKIEREEQNKLAGRVDFLYSLNGLLIYTIMLASSILIINYQNTRLVNEQALTTRPILPYQDSDVIESVGAIQAADLIEEIDINYIKNSGNWFNYIIGNFISDPNEGWLEIELNRPSSIELELADGTKNTISYINGSLRVKLYSPFTLTIEPGLKDNDSILWKGKLIKADENTTNKYKVIVQQTIEDAASNVLPQNNDL